MKTIEALEQLGFDENLQFDFGNLTLSAMETLNRHFVEIVLIAGVFSNHRMISNVEIEIPLQVESTAQAAAFIAWGINKQIGRNFTPQNLTQWLEEGKNNFDLLPFVKEQKLYEKRPKCYVDRDWLRLAFRDLRLLLTTLDENDILSFTFKDEVLSIRSRLKLIVLPATGRNWESQYDLTVGNFQNLPKRLNNSEIEISIWNGYLNLANWRYPLSKLET